MSIRDLHYTPEQYLDLLETSPCLCRHPLKTLCRSRPPAYILTHGLVICEECKEKDHHKDILGESGGIQELDKYCLETIPPIDKFVDGLNKDGYLRPHGAFDFNPLSAEIIVWLHVGATILRIDIVQLTKYSDLAPLKRDIIDHINKSCEEYKKNKIT